MTSGETSPGRRIPLHSICGPTPEATESLRLRFLLIEIDRQADLFCRSFSDAYETGRRDDADETWRHLQGALFAAIVVNRLLTNDKPYKEYPGWTRTEAVAAARWRVDELRRVLAVPSPEDRPDLPFYRVALVRHSLEHIDERLDRALRSPGISSLSDWYLSGGTFLVTPDGAEDSGAIAGLRAFFPEAGVLLFDRSEIDMFQLDIDMLRLRHNVNEAVAELPTHGGRGRFGGPQLVQVSEAKAIERHERWLRDRAAALKLFDDDGAPATDG